MTSRSSASVRYRSPVPPSLHNPDTADRLMSGLRALSRGYAAIVSRDRIIEPAAVDRVLPLVVVDTELIADGVRRLTLTAADGTVLPAWHPGAHIDLTLPSGSTRQYSLCGNQFDRTRYTVAVRRVPGGAASAEIHDRLPAGAQVTAGGPRNAFPFAYPHLAPTSGITRVVFVAAGIGITALLPMVRAAESTKVDWHLTYLGRSTDTMAFLDDIGGCASHRVRILTGARRTATELLANAGPGASVYFCGPASLLDDIRTAYDDTGAAGLHFERFSPPAVVGGRPFELHLARTGRSIPVAAEQSALDAVRETGTDAAYSCRQGFCGTCRVRVVSGGVERRGSSPFLDRPDTMLTCTDRAASNDLTVDL